MKKLEIDGDLFNETNNSVTVLNEERKFLFKSFLLQF